MNYPIKLEAVSKSYLLSDVYENSLQMFLSNKLKSLFKKSRKETITLEALKEISFNVEKGERLGIIGPNGSGKSTLLKLLSKVTYPSKGHISVEGRTASLLEIGTGFHQELSGRENIFLFGAILGMSKQEIADKYQEIVDFSEIGPFMESPIKFYSSGMQIRLAFSVYAHSEPDILLIDEALGVGDASFQQKCMHKMNEQAKRDTTILLVSHDLGLVRRFCTRCIYLDKGQIVAICHPEQIINQYLQNEDLKAVEPLPQIERTKPVEAAIYLEDVYIKSNLDVYTPGDDLVIHSKIKINDPIKQVYYTIKFLQDGKPGYAVVNFFKKLSPRADYLQVETIIPLKPIARGTYNFRMELYHFEQDLVIDKIETDFEFTIVTSRTNNEAPIVESNWQILN